MSNTPERMQLDLQFVKLCQDVVTTLNEIDNFMTDLPEKQSNIDKAISDLLHEIQNNDLTDEQYINIGKEIKKYRLQRECYKNLGNLKLVYKHHKQKLINNSTQRQVFCDAMNNALKDLQMTYKNRIINEEEMKKIINAPIIKPKLAKTKLKENEKEEAKKNTKKPRKIPVRRLNKDEVVSLFNRGFKPLVIAQKMGCSSGTVYHVIADYKKNKKKS